MPDSRVGMSVGRMVAPVEQARCWRAGPLVSQRGTGSGFVGARMNRRSALQCAMGLCREGPCRPTVGTYRMGRAMGNCYP